MASMRELSEFFLQQTLANKQARDYEMGAARFERDALPTPAQTANFIGAMAPGAALADMRGGYPMTPDRDAVITEAFSEDYGPSLIENLDEGNYTDAFLQGLGGLGDLATIAGPVGVAAGSLLKLPRAVKASRGGAMPANQVGAIRGIEETAERPEIFTFPDYDPRFSPRLKKTAEGKVVTPVEAKRVGDLTVETQGPKNIDVDDAYLGDYEGRAIMTTMSDRTAAGPPIVEINGVKLFRPVELQGGQDFMFKDYVWGSDDKPIGQISRMAEKAKKLTGKDPVLAPFRMAPTGGDHAAMTVEAMLSYGAANMAKKDIKDADKLIKEILPEWKGMKSDKSIELLRKSAGSKRKAVQNMLDKKFRDKGGLSLTEARLAVADHSQLTARDAGLQNLGEIYAGRPIIKDSGHYTYPQALEGEGLGRIANVEDLTIFDLLPNVVEERAIPTRTVEAPVGSNTGSRVLADPRATDIRAMQMKPYMSILDDKMLKRLGQ